MINTESSELQSMTALELTNMTVYSMCSNPRFARLICSEERIKSRYRFFYVSSGLKDNDKTTRDIRNKTRNSKDFQVFVFVFSYPDQDPGVDDSLLSLVSGAVTVIDATAVRMDREVNERYARNMVCYNLAGGRHNPDAAEHIDRAYEELRPWTERVLSSPVRVHDKEHPEGSVYETLSAFYERILRESCAKYSCSPDTMGLDDFFFLSVGARFYVRDGFYAQSLSPWNFTDPERTPVKLFSFVWGNDSAWYDPEYADEKIVILKKVFDAYLEDRLEKGEKISFREIFGVLQEPPYGLLPNIIGAILMGMFFRTWRDRGLIWTNGISEDILDDAHLLAMVENGIHNQRTRYKNSLVDYIMMPDPKTAGLIDAASGIFGLDKETTRFLPELRAGLRFAMEALPCPIQSAQHAPISDADRETVDMLIRFVRLTSDDADKEHADDLVDRLSSAFRDDPGLIARMRECLYGSPLRDGFVRMLEANGIDPAGVTAEKLDHLCCGHREWKWIWQEKTLVRYLRGLTIIHVRPLTGANSSDLVM